MLGDAVHAEAKGLPGVMSIRSLGLAAAIDVAPLPGAPGKRAFDIFTDCYKKGVLIRPAADTLVLAPPFIVERAQIETMVSVLTDSIRAHA